MWLRLPCWIRIDQTFGETMHQPARSNIPYVPASRRSGLAGDTTITTFNLYNLFELLQTPNGPAPPQALATKLAKLVLALRYELLLPDILVVQEVESEQILQKVADAVNDVAATAYQATSLPCSDRRGIQVGFLWDRKRVDLLHAYQLSGTAVSTAFGPDSPSPGREPLVGIFRLKRKELTIIANHFKSDYIGDADNSDKERLWQACLIQRQAQARVVRDFVNTLLQTDEGRLLMVAGDLNQMPPAPDDQTASANPIAILQGSAAEPPLTNLLPTRASIHNYTYVSERGPVILDHILVSPALFRHFIAVDVHHFNVAYPDTYQTDPTTAVRVSDHDPLEARFIFNTGVSQENHVS
jgi:predicted extracellular nuclease